MGIDAKRDWGHARDYVQMMWMMLQKEQADDYVVATGETNTVRCFIELAFGVVGIKIDPKYFRPTEVELLIGDPSKAKRQLGWTPTCKVEELCKEMVESDIALVEKGDLTS